MERNPIEEICIQQMIKIFIYVVLGAFYGHASQRIVKFVDAELRTRRVHDAVHKMFQDDDTAYPVPFDNIFK
jgi:hypothetical protein